MSCIYDRVSDLGVVPADSLGPVSREHAQKVACWPEPPTQKGGCCWSEGDRVCGAVLAILVPRLYVLLVKSHQSCYVHSSEMDAEVRKLILHVVNVGAGLATIIEVDERNSGMRQQVTVYKVSRSI